MNPDQQGNNQDAIHALLSIANAIKGLVGNVIPLLWRQGGSSTNWATAGSTNYNLGTSQPIIQVGTRTVSGTAGTDVTITFPTPFLYTPVVIVSTASANGANVQMNANSITTTTFKARILFTGGGSFSEECCWIAIGVTA